MSKQVVFSSKLMSLMILAVAGFGLFQGARLLDQGTGPYSSGPYVIIGVTLGGMCCLFLAILSYKANFNELRPLFFAGVLLLVARISVFFVAVPSEALLLMAQLAAGIGWMLLLICWMQIFASYRPLYSISMIAAGYLIDLAVVPVINMLFPHGRYVAFVCVFILSIIALGICLKNNRFVADVMIDEAPSGFPIPKLMVRAALILFAIFVIAVPYGFVLQIDIIDGLNYVQTNLTSVLGIGATSILFVFLLIFRPQGRTIDAAYPVAATCFVVILLLRAFFPGNEQLFGSVMAAFLMTFFGVFWITFVSEAFERKLPSFFLLGLAVGVAQLSIAGGRFTAFAVQGVGVVNNPTAMVLSAISFIAIAGLLVVTAATVRYTRRKKTMVSNGGYSTEGVLKEPTEHGGSDLSNLVSLDIPEASHDSVSSVSHAALELLCDSFQLSKREFQIVTEYSTGRSARFIADSLMLSEHTIKSHLRRAYVKMDVHSRQELLSLIDQMEALVHAQNRDAADDAKTALSRKKI